MAEWQPIETAPRNNHARLVWVPDNRSTFCVVWRDGTPDRPEGWCIFGGDWRAFLQGATLWQPQPEPPNEPGKETDREEEREEKEEGY